jgi:hypothetical protein
LTVFIQIRLYLEHIDPSVPWLVLIAAAFVGTYLLRKFAPTLWVTIAAWGPPDSTLAHVTQALPGTVASAVVAALGTGLNPWAAALGAACGLIAPLVHHLAKFLKFIPYRGALGKLVDGPTSRRLIAQVLNQELDKL